MVLRLELAAVGPAERVLLTERRADRRPYLIVLLKLDAILVLQPYAARNRNSCLRLYLVQRARADLPR